MVQTKRKRDASDSTKSTVPKLKQEAGSSNISFPKTRGGARSTRKSKVSIKEEGVDLKAEDEGEELQEVKKEETNDEEDGQEVKEETGKSSKKGKKSNSESLQLKKLQAYTKHSTTSPFPDFPQPTPEAAKLAHKILREIHGARIRPKEVKASSTRAGCGDSPSVLDALVRTILSQNTSDVNSSRAKQSMDRVYGGHDNWPDIVKGGQGKLQESIKSGGLSVVKSKVILSILEQVHEKYGKYSLDHLFNLSDEEAMKELLGFQGVGPKTASCVLLFCLQRESFAVDTHVYRITGLLGWRPMKANRDETHSHLESKIPDEDKYGLHVLLVTHGKRCEECKAGGKNLGKCELRKAFRKAKLEGDAGVGEMKEEEGLVEMEQEDEDEGVVEGDEEVKAEVKTEGS